MVWEIIDKFSQIIGLISAFPIVYSAWVLWRLHRTKKEELERIRTEPGERPGVLIVDSIRSGAEPIQPQVENWLWMQQEFQSQKDKVCIETAEFKGDLKPESMDQIVEKIRTSVGKLQTKGITKYHVFIRGPMLLAATTGGILFNHRPAVFYQQGNEGGYMCWGAINR